MLSVEKNCMCKRTHDNSIRWHWSQLHHKVEKMLFSSKIDQITVFLLDFYCFFASFVVSRFERRILLVGRRSMCIVHSPRRNKSVNHCIEIKNDFGLSYGEKGATISQCNVTTLFLQHGIRQNMKVSKWKVLTMRPTPIHIMHTNSSQSKNLSPWHMFAFNFFSTSSALHHRYASDLTSKSIYHHIAGGNQTQSSLITYLGQQIMMQRWFDPIFSYRFLCHKTQFNCTSAQSAKDITVHIISSIITLQANCIWTGTRWITS